MKLYCCLLLMVTALIYRLPSSFFVRSKRNSSSQTSNGSPNIQKLRISGGTCEVSSPLPKRVISLITTTNGYPCCLLAYQSDACLHVPSVWQVPVPHFEVHPSPSHLLLYPYLSPAHKLLSPHLLIPLLTLLFSLIFSLPSLSLHPCFSYYAFSILYPLQFSLSRIALTRSVCWPCSVWFFLSLFWKLTDASG